MRWPMLAAMLLAAMPAAAADWMIEVRLRPDLLQARNWTPADEAAVGRHFAQVQALLATGTARFAGRSRLKDGAGNDDPAMFGVIVLSGIEHARAEAILQADEAIRAGVMTGRLHPFYIVPHPAAAQPTR